MSHGGSRVGAGRKPGQATKLNEEARQQALGGGISPLDYMLKILRDEAENKEMRFEAAKAAAPYVHARLSTTDSTVTADLTGGFTWLPPQP
jgi:hypothetical protein